MIRISLLHSAALALAFTAPASPAAAQAVMVAAPNPDADRLTQTMRTLAADPRDLTALIEAGRLSTRLNDMSAALAFFQRAESVSPGDPRIAAGRAAVLVRKERPGEALRLFQSAEARGAAMRDYAADRGFAYDLLGQPGLAQADYKLAMQRERDDELVRRYALSLGISGQADEAATILDPLLRRSDRAAWRARAFILAMNGEIAGAEKIAASMMPGMGQSLAPFFRRLAGLSTADRAFAVHFGELSPTQTRLADARMAPALPRYVPEQRPVQVAARPAPVAAQSRTRDRRSARDRRRQEVAAVTPAPAPARAAPPARGPVFAQQRSPTVQPLPPVASAPVAQPPAAASAPVFAQQRSPIVQPLPTPAPSPAVPAVAVAAASTSPAPASSPSSGVASAAPASAAPVQLASARPPASAASPTRPPVAEASAAPQPAAAPPATVAPPAQAAASPVQVAQGTSPVEPAAVDEPNAEARMGVARSEPAPPGPAAVGQEDSVLASIVANLTIPAAELEAANSMALPPPAPEITPAPPPVEEAPKPAPARPAPIRRAEAAKLAVKPEKDDKVATGKAGKAAAAKADSAKPDKSGKTGKTADAKTKPVAKPDPERVWVQVAGGANAGDLTKAWKAVSAKAPAQFKGKSGWWTPVRASNRLLAGPFKTSAEGQAFVNTLAKAGVSGFVFTSEAGQKVSKIGEK